MQLASKARRASTLMGADDGSPMRAGRRSNSWPSAANPSLRSLKTRRPFPADCIISSSWPPLESFIIRPGAGSAAGSPTKSSETRGSSRSRRRLFKFDSRASRPLGGDLLLAGARAAAAAAATTTTTTMRKRSLEWSAGRTVFTAPPRRATSGPRRRRRREEEISQVGNQSGRIELERQPVATATLHR